MGAIKISLPESLRRFVEEQARRRHYRTGGEYVRELIRKDRDREHLRGRLLEGRTSALTTKADRRYFDSLRERVGRRVRR